jgi:hypothetical protein
MRISFLLGLGMLLLASCNNTVYKSHTAKSMEIYGSGVMHLPVVADLSVRTAKVSFSVNDKNTSMNMRQLREAAIAGALQEHKADVLVEPSFSLERKRRVNTLTVSGWPADYTQFRTMDTTDIRLMDAGTLHRAETSTPVTEAERPRKQIGAAVALTVTGVILLLSLTLAAF